MIYAPKHNTDTFSRTELGVGESVNGKKKKQKPKYNEIKSIDWEFMTSVFKIRKIREFYEIFKFMLAHLSSNHNSTSDIPHWSIGWLTITDKIENRFLFDLTFALICSS